jgi:RES domain-containing protein
VPAGVDPLRTRPRATPGRFHRPGEIALYLADRAETAWAEWYRALAERAVEPDEDLPRDLCQIAVSLGEVVDLSTAATRQRAGLPARMRPAASQWSVFQHFATDVRAQGAQGILYASSARARSLCLGVLEAGLPGLEVVGEPIRVIAAPAPPRGLRT